MKLNIEENLKKIEIKGQAFINGSYQNSIDSNTISKVSSIDGRELPSLSACNEKDINKAVKNSLEKYEEGVWRNKTTVERKEIILKLADLVEENITTLAFLDCLETGRSLKNYYYDSLPKAVETMRWFAEAVDKIYDKAIPPENNSLGIITRESLGVVGIITPWNDPLVVSFWKLTPALLMGNSVVLKPAEQSSFSILKVAKLAIEAGVPKGVFNVLPGYGDEAGKALALHNDIRAIFFTGSTSVGKKILQYSGQSNLKKVGLECGGKSPIIVSQNYKNLKKVAQTISKNIFYNQGQICSAPSRLLVDNSIKEELLKLLVEDSNNYIPSNPLSLDSEVGAVVSKEQKERIDFYIKEGIKEGAKIITSTDEISPYKNGVYSRPTIFVDVDVNSKIATEEIFGPVLVVIGFDFIKDAIKIANKSEYGLAASIWSNDFDEAHQVSKSLEAGIVHINSYGEDDNRAPFGGIKQSGLGKDKSIYAFDEYSSLKTIWMHIDNI